MPKVPAGRTQLNVVMTDDLYDRLRLLSFSSHESMNFLVVQAIDNYLTDVEAGSAAERQP